MNDFLFQQPEWLLLLIPVALLGIVAFKAYRKTETIRAKLGGKRAPLRPAGWLGLLAAILMVLAIARPVSDPEPSPVYREGRDVIFVLDVSRSMLAQDMQPSRLELAKLAINDCIECLPSGRVGLVLFAGSASIRCPLTEDRAFLRTALADAGLHSVSAGSTFLQSAVEKTTDRLLSEKRRGFQDIVLLTDGGDHSESLEQSAALLAGSGARVIIIGFGNSQLGARVPLEQAGEISYLMDEGKEVWVKQEQEPLQELATRSGGIYLNASNGIFHLGSEYQAVSAHLAQAASEGKLEMKYHERFIWFLGAALGLILLGGTTRFWGRHIAGVLVALLLCHGTQAQTEVERMSESITAAKTAWAENDFSTAANHYLEATEFATSSAQRTQIALATAQAWGRAAEQIMANDPYAAAQLIEQAELILLEQRRADPSLQLAINELCCVYDTQERVSVLIVAKEKADAEMQAEISKLFEILQALVDRQRELVTQCSEIRPKRRVPHATPERIAELCAFGATTQPPIPFALAPIIEQLEQLNKLFVEQFGETATEQSPFQRAGLLLADAEAILHNAAMDYKGGLAMEGLEMSETGLRRMEEALGLFADQSQSSEDGDEDESETDDEYEESDEYGDGEMSMEQMQGSAGRMDFENRQLPEPQFSAEEILQEESEKTEARKQAGSEGDDSVEKDW
jgi:uncharacterized protein YegL